MTEYYAATLWCGAQSNRMGWLAEHFTHKAHAYAMEIVVLEALG